MVAGSRQLLGPQGDSGKAFKQCSRFIEAVSRCKREILEDIASGQVPCEVKDFAQLHDFVDANEYGGACEQLPETEAGLSEFFDFWNRVMDEVDVWMKSKGHRCSCHPVATSAGVMHHIDCTLRPPSKNLS